MSALPRTEHWHDAAWRRMLAEQQADQLLRLRLLLTRRVRWLRHRSGREPLSGYPIAVVSDAEADAALRPPDPAGEAEFARGDEEMARLSRSVAGIETQLDERSRAMAAAGTPFPADELAEAFGLDVFEREIVGLALAPELDPAFERLFAYAQDDAARRHATPALAVDLFAPATGTEFPTTLRPDAPMFAMALLRRDPPPAATGTATRPLRLDPRIVWYLQAADVPGDLAGARLIRRAPTPVPEELEQAASDVVRMLGSQPSATRSPLVNLVGRDGPQAAALAERIAAGAGLALHVVETDGDADPASTAACLVREARLRRSALLLDGLDAHSADRLAALADRLRGPVLLATSHPARTERATVTVTVPTTQPATRRALWAQALPDLVNDPQRPLDALVHHFSLDADSVARVAAAARGAARLRGRPVSSADVWQWCRRYGRRRLSSLAEAIEPRAGWDDIVLPTDLRRQLAELASQVRHRAVVYEEWGFGDAPSRSGGVTALFAGPSGTGKTMAAEVVAGELGLDLYRIDLAGVVDKYIGETEKNLRRVFDAAESSGAVLFFDEADALFGKRTEVRDSHDRYANIEVNYLLQRMERYTGLAILATNRKAVLDRAFLRRLAFLVDFPFPAADTRLRIWQKLLPASAPLDRVDFGALARMELTGGNIRSIALNAAFLAAGDGRRITMGVLMHAAAREYAKLDKTPTDAEFGQYPKAVGA